MLALVIIISLAYLTVLKLVIVRLESSVGKCLPSMNEALGSIPGTKKKIKN
jgi:hypothetical protein